MEEFRQGWAASADVPLCTERRRFQRTKDNTVLAAGKAHPVLGSAGLDRLGKQRREPQVVFSLYSKSPAHSSSVLP